MSSEQNAPSEPRPLSIGLIGCGYITKKWLAAIEGAGHRVAALASRGKMTRAQDYAKMCTLSNPSTYDDYSKLLDHKGLDAVYFSLPTSKRAEWVIRALERGLPVLVEKPMASGKIVARMVVLAEKKGVQFMDAVMLMHHPRLGAMRDARVAARVGDPRLVTSVFASGEMAKTNIRYDPKLEPFGALGDLGWYNIRISLWAFNYALPARARAVSMAVTSSGAHTSSHAVLEWADGRSATLSCNFNETAMVQQALIVGTKGFIELPNFCISRNRGAKFSVSQSRWGDFDKKEFDVSQATETHELEPVVQEVEAIKTFARCIRSGKAEQFWPEVALKTQLVLDACLESAKKGGVPIPIVTVEAALKAAKASP